MRLRVIAVLGLLALPAFGMASGPIAPALADEANSTLDQLFLQLGRAPDAKTANNLAQEIWHIWFTPADPVLAAKMNAAMLARQLGDMAGCIAILNHLVEKYPDYAEGWNQRATMNYLTDKFDASLADIDKVLALEPRHFGARTGRVMILLQQGRRNEALKEMIAALAIHPFLNEKRLFPELAQSITNI